MIFNKKQFQLLREQQGLTLEEVAKACGVSKQTVQKWEKSKSLQPRPAKIPLLAQLLRCKESDIAQYGGNLELTMDQIQTESEQFKDMLLGADVENERINITSLVNHRAEEDPSDPDYETNMREYEKTIIENLLLAFQKICATLKVRELPLEDKQAIEDALFRFRAGIISALIASDIPAEAKDKALQIVNKV